MSWYPQRTIAQTRTAPTRAGLGARRASRILLTLLCLLPACSATKGTAQATSGTGDQARTVAPARPDKAKLIKLNFENMPIPLLAKFFGDLTDKHYILRGVGSERVDLKLDHRVTVEEAERLFLAEIARRGYVVTNDGKTVHVTDPRLPAPQHTPAPQ